MVVVVRASRLAGSVARPLGRALAAAGRTDEAIDALEAAIAADRARGGIPFAAHAQRDLAETLLARGAPGDAERAGALLEEAAATADLLGLAEPARRARTLLARLRPRLQHEVERRLGCAADRGEARLLEHRDERASPVCVPSAGVSGPPSAIACGTQISAEPA